MPSICYWGVKYVIVVILFSFFFFFLFISQQFSQYCCEVKDFFVFFLKEELGFLGLPLTCLKRRILKPNWGICMMIVFGGGVWGNDDTIEIS